MAKRPTARKRRQRPKEAIPLAPGISTQDPADEIDEIDDIVEPAPIEPPTLDQQDSRQITHVPEKEPIKDQQSPSEPPSPVLPTPGTTVAQEPIEPDNQYDPKAIVHLSIIANAHEITVAEFRAHAKLGNDARQVLDYLIDGGLVERTWRDGQGRYRVTKTGAEMIL